MKEKLKNALLVGNLLLLVLLFFFNLTINLQLSPSMGPLYRLAQRMRGESVQETLSVSSSGPIVYPYRMAVVNDGEVCGLQGEEYISLLYDKVRPLLAEAMGSAEKPEKIQQETYQRLATRGNALRLEYDGEIPLYLLRIWANAGDDGFDLTVPNLSICETEGRIRLVFWSQSQKNYYQCVTEAGTDLFFEILRAYPGNDAYFAAQDQTFSVMSADDLIFPGIRKISSYQVTVPEAPEKEALGAILEAFEMNRYQANPYQDAEEATVYVQGNSVLRLEKDGRLVYSQQGTETAEGSTRQQLVTSIEQVRQAVNRAAQATGCMGDVFLKKVAPINGGGGDVLYFEYRIGGIPVGSEKEDWVSAEVKNGKIVFLEMRLRKVSIGEETPILPYQQAIAALPQGAKNVRLSIRYFVSENTLTPYISYASDGESQNGMEKG